jgi:hypothetical protein
MTEPREAVRIRFRNAAAVDHQLLDLLDVLHVAHPSAPVDEDRERFPGFADSRVMI